MFHCFGQNAVLNSGLNACSTVVLHREFDLDKLLSSITVCNITMFFGVPTTYILLLNSTSPGDLRPIRYYFSAAAAMPVEIAQRWWDKYGIVINEGYGLTETSPFASYNHDLEYRLGSIGTPIENVEMKIVGSDSEEVAPGEPGEIVIRGPNVMLGYWNRPEETAEVIKNGWLHSGDIGKIDDKGYFYLVDRVKDMVNVAGLKVYPVEVENVIHGHPAVAEVAVYGIPDAVTGERVAANIVLKAGHVTTEGEILAFCRSRIAVFKVPSDIEFVELSPQEPNRQGAQAPPTWGVKDHDCQPSGLGEMSMKVLVTGGAGYIGSHTVRELVNRRHEAIVLDSLESGRRELAERAGASKLIVGSTSDRTLLDSIFAEERPQAVMHFAAYKAAGESVEQPEKYFANNIVNTLQLLGAMLHYDVKFFIFSSSCSIFGTPRIIPVAEDNNPTSPESPYGESKLVVEKILGWYDRAYDLKSISLRYFNAAGASLDGQLGEDWSTSHNLVPLVMKAALGRVQSVQIFGTDYPTPDGTCIRDYVHVADLAVAHVLSLEHLAASNLSTAYNLGTERGSSVKEVIDTIRWLSNSDFKVEYAGRRPGDPPAIWADSSRAQRELGWHPRYELDIILRTAYEWHKAHPDGY